VAGKTTLTLPTELLSGLAASLSLQKVTTMVQFDHVSLTSK